jgi:hypothetical protein
MLQLRRRLSHGSWGLGDLGFFLWILGTLDYLWKKIWLETTGNWIGPSSCGKRMKNSKITESSAPAKQIAATHPDRPIKCITFEWFFWFLWVLATRRIFKIPWECILLFHQLSMHPRVSQQAKNRGETLEYGCRFLDLFTKQYKNQLESTGKTNDRPENSDLPNIDRGRTYRQFLSAQALARVVMDKITDKWCCDVLSSVLGEFFLNVGITFVAYRSLLNQTTWDNFEMGDILGSVITYFSYMSTGFRFRKQIREMLGLDQMDGRKPRREVDRFKIFGTSVSAIMSVSKLTLIVRMGLWPTDIWFWLKSLQQTLHQLVDDWTPALALRTALGKPELGSARYHTLYGWVPPPSYKGKQSAPGSAISAEEVSILGRDKRLSTGRGFRSASSTPGPLYTVCCLKVLYLLHLQLNPLITTINGCGFCCMSLSCRARSHLIVAACVGLFDARWEHVTGNPCPFHNHVSYVASMLPPCACGVHIEDTVQGNPSQKFFHIVTYCIVSYVAYMMPLCACCELLDYTVQGNPSQNFSRIVSYVAYMVRTLNTINGCGFCCMSLSCTACSHLIVAACMGLFDARWEHVTGNPCPFHNHVSYVAPMLTPCACGVHTEDTVQGNPSQKFFHTVSYCIVSYVAYMMPLCGCCELLDDTVHGNPLQNFVRIVSYVAYMVRTINTINVCGFWCHNMLFDVCCDHIHVIYAACTVPLCDRCGLLYGSCCPYVNNIHNHTPVTTKPVTTTSGCLSGGYKTGTVQGKPWQNFWDNYRFWWQGSSLGLDSRKVQGKLWQKFWDNLRFWKQAPVLGLDSDHGSMKTLDWGRNRWLGPRWTGNKIQRQKKRVANVCIVIAQPGRDLRDSRDIDVAAVWTFGPFEAKYVDKTTGIGS